MTDTDVRCAAPDRTLPAWQMTCGFPAAFTTTADDGSTVGLCSTCAPAAVLSGYALTPMPEVAR
jgi:hypothetical protein